MDFIKTVSDFALWVKELVEQVILFVLETFFEVFDWLWQGFLSMFDSLGVALSINKLSSLLFLIPDTVWYFANIAEVQYGIGVVLGAFSIRFLIRRIPLFG